MAKKGGKKGLPPATKQGGKKGAAPTLTTAQQSSLPRRKFYCGIEMRLQSTRLVLVDPALSGGARYWKLIPSLNVDLDYDLIAAVIIVAVDEFITELTRYDPTSLKYKDPIYKWINALNWREVAVIKSMVFATADNEISGRWKGLVAHLQETYSKPYKPFQDRDEADRKNRDIAEQYNKHLAEKFDVVTHMDLMKQLHFKSGDTGILIQLGDMSNWRYIEDGEAYEPEFIPQIIGFGGGALWLARTAIQIKVQEMETTVQKLPVPRPEPDVRPDALDDRPIEEIVGPSAKTDYREPDRLEYALDKQMPGGFPLIMANENAFSLFYKHRLIAFANEMANPLTHRDDKMIQKVFDAGGESLGRLLVEILRQYARADKPHSGILRVLVFGPTATMVPYMANGMFEAVAGHGFDAMHIYGQKEEYAAAAAICAAIGDGYRCFKQIEDSENVLTEPARRVADKDSDRFKDDLSEKSRDSGFDGRVPMRMTKGELEELKRKESLALRWHVARRFRRVVFANNSDENVAATCRTNSMKARMYAPKRYSLFSDCRTSLLSTDRNSQSSTGS